MKAENCFIHNPSQEEHPVCLFLLRNAAEFIVEGNCYFCFQEFLFCSVVALSYVYQNSLTLSRYET